MSSQWLNDTLAAITIVAQGDVSNAATQAAVTALTAKLSTDEGSQAATNAEFQQAITALVKALAVAPPATGTGTLPTLTALSAANGAVAGGNTVTLTGTGFSNGLPVVNFDAIAGTAVAVQSDTSLTVVAPAHPAGVAQVTIVTSAGTSASLPYTYS